MIYAYIRVSTDKQTAENQRFEIEQFCARESIKINKWICETASGTKKANERHLGSLLKDLKKDDTLICSEISRLGRNMLMIMSILNECLNSGIKVWTIKDNYRLGDDINSQVLAFACGLSAQIERQLISQRTKDALVRKKAEGFKLGCPLGTRRKTVKMDKYAVEIGEYLNKGVPVAIIAKLLSVNRIDIYRYLNRESSKPQIERNRYGKNFPRNYPELVKKIT